MGGEQHLEVVGGEGDDVEKQGGHVHCEQVAQDPPSQGDLQFFSNQYIFPQGHLDHH